MDPPQDPFCASNNTESFLSEDCKDDVEKHLKTDGKKSCSDREKKLPFVCCICQESFSSVKFLKKHELSHSAPFVCSECTREFRRMKNLKMHLAEHSRYSLHVCDECGKAFRTESQLMLHHHAHADKKPLVCAYCNRGFVHLYSLKRHCEQHRVVTFQVGSKDSDIFPKKHAQKEARSKSKRPVKPLTWAKIPKKANKPCFWDTLRKGFSKSYLKDRQQAMGKK